MYYGYLFGIGPTKKLFVDGEFIGSATDFFSWIDS
jgi:hypothetical protein